MPMVGSASCPGSARISSETSSREEVITLADGATATSRQLRMVGMTAFSLILIQTAGALNGTTVVINGAKGRQFRRIWQQVTAAAALGNAEWFPAVGQKFPFTGRAVTVTLTAPQAGGPHTYIVRLSAGAGM